MPSVNDHGSCQFVARLNMVDSHMVCDADI
jgi:hypothetical protein